MFGVGPQEMMVIALFALIIFGPGKLPEVMKEAGKHYRKFKGMADQMTGEFNKVTAEARKELDGALGDLGPMGKDIEKSLGMGKTTRTNTTTTGSRKTGTSSTTGKATTAAKSSRTTAAGSKTSAAKSTSGSTAAKGATKIGNTTTTTTAKPKVASKEDPLADFEVFAPPARETKRRARTASPRAITDLTPRDFFSEPSAAQDGDAMDLSAIEDPVARARARRRQAYVRAQA